MNYYVARLSQGSCLPRQFQVDAAGRVPCTVVEVLPTACEVCAELDRGSVSTEIASTLRAALRSDRSCGETGTPSCDELCLCDIPQLQGSELERCQTESVTPDDLSGFCYVDTGQGIGSAAVTDMCPPSAKRLFRFAGDAAPRAGNQVFVVCTAL